MCSRYTDTNWHAIGCAANGVSVSVRIPGAVTHNGRSSISRWPTLANVENTLQRISTSKRDYWRSRVVSLSGTVDSELQKVWQSGLDGVNWIPICDWLGNCTALQAVDISNLFRSHTLYHQSCDAPTEQVNWLEATFRKIFQDIFSSFEFGSELDPKNTGLLGVVECNHNYGLAFNLDESRLNFMREQWRWRKRVGSIDYVPETSAMNIVFKGRKCKKKHTPFLPIKILYINVRITNEIRITRRPPLEMMILWPPAASFSSASTCPRAASRTSTHESDRERASLLFGGSATTISYHIFNAKPKVATDVISWMAGWIFTAHQMITLVCLDESIANPEHLLFSH